MNAVLTIVFLLLRTAAGQNTSVFLAADSPQLQYTGRVAKNGTHVLWDWSGVKTSFRLKCPANITVDVQFHIDVPVLQNPLSPSHKDRYASKYSVSVNGVNGTGFQTKASMYGNATTTYTVELPATSRDVLLVELVKNTEEFTVPCWASWSEGGQPTVFHGITVPGSCSPLSPPARPTRRLEFIGDSITCGFGMLANNLIDHAACVLPPEDGMHGWLDFEDFGLAFPSLLSHRLQAEMHTQCVSQIGITRNGITFTKRTPYNMSHYLHRTLPTVPNPAFLWDYTSWTPDVAVVNLGTNDFDVARFFHEQPSFADFEGNFTAFLEDYINHYGDRLANLLVLCGPMIKMQCPSVKRVVTTLKESYPEMNIRYLEVTATLTGCVWHPGVEGQRQIYEQLVPVISDMTGWSTFETTAEIVV